MSSSGRQIFRNALLAESAINIASLFPIILSPESVLSYLVRGPSQITPATKTLTQWFGCVIVMSTAPLLYSYPEPTLGQSAGEVTARRQAAYMTLGAGELALGALTAASYLTGDSGMTDQALLTATGMLAAFGGMRAFFLFMKPAWMEATQSSIKKA